MVWFQKLQTRYQNKKMKILNRGFISIKPTNLYIDWKLNQSQEELIEPENPEATIYLIEEEFWDDEIILNKYFKIDEL